MRAKPTALSVLAAVAFAAFYGARANAQAGGAIVQLDSLRLRQMTSGYQRPQAGKSIDGNPLTLGGKVYEHGIGTHAVSRLTVDLKGQAAAFHSIVGVDDEKKGAGSVVFEVRLDNRRVLRTRVMRGGDTPQEININLRGAKTISLIADDAGDGIDSDHADWADATITMAPDATAQPVTIAAPPLPPAPMPVLAFGDGPVPAIHNPRITGATPGRPFLFRIPATGQGPLTYTAKNLPAGLRLDPKTGIITGALQGEGRTNVALTVKGPKGVAKGTLTIVGGQNALAQTPPMGWNSWNVWACAVDDAKVRAAADWMMKSGLAAHGFQYINIDDCWQANRDADGNIVPNSKFPDMKALSDYVHSKGLKLGIYSSPGPKTCAGYEGSYQHDQKDADTWAKWGIDYVKYDWCSYGGIAPNNSLAELQKPYFLMRDALANCGRDIVYSLCQYGMGDVWKWGAEVNGNLWRTTGDINDSWGSMAGIGFSQDGHEKFAGPGHWNDPDMLVVGKVGWGPSLHPSRLAPDEQVTHITLWSLLSSPLLIGCDMSQMDRFTLALLTNDEVLGVNQDPLGKPAGRKAQDGELEVWARPLADGTTAVGLFNRGYNPAKVTARFADLGLRGRQPVRNLWQRKAVGIFKDAYTATVPAHGAVLVKIGTPKA